MKENQTIRGYKRMKLNFYMDNVRRLGGEKNVHFNFVSNGMERKRMIKRLYKKRADQKVKRPLLETLNSYLEARRCKTLENFIGGEKA
jgi:hypothetical protein